jgi:hypothetical protein
MKERPMALKEIELRPGWFIYRCESCGFEHPQMGVKKQFLGAPPKHRCPESLQMSFAGIAQDK